MKCLIICRCEEKSAIGMNDFRCFLPYLNFFAPGTPKCHAGPKDTLIHSNTFRNARKGRLES